MRPSSTTMSLGRPGSKAGLPIDENSVKIDMEPSFLWSGYGCMISPFTKASTCACPNCTSTDPSSLHTPKMKCAHSAGRAFHETLRTPTFSFTLLRSPAFAMVSRLPPSRSYTFRSPSKTQRTCEKTD
jgi:hypothetical protein